MSNPEMGQDFVKNLPSEISIEILSRLPIPTIRRCKCVCKSWLYLLETHEFVKTHLSKSVPGLAVSCADGEYCSDCSHTDCSDCTDLNWCKVFEFEDELDLECHDLHYNLVTKFDYPHRLSIEGSVNGLLCLSDFDANNLFICNPITYEIIDLDCQDRINEFTFGFGVSQISGQYKVVRISHDYCGGEKTQKELRIPSAQCHVYTLGTGLWRIIEPNVQLQYKYDYCHVGPIFLNGNLHWLVRDINYSTCISCFDIEAELFTIFSVPPLPPRHEKFHRALSALKDFLCLCDNSEGELVIWLMKEYGDAKSWTKEFIINKCPRDLDDFEYSVYPINVFKDGDILIGVDDEWPVYYSIRTNTINDIEMPEMCSGGWMDAILHTPSFLSLKCFPMEYVNSLDPRPLPRVTSKSGALSLFVIKLCYCILVHPCMFPVAYCSSPFHNASVLSDT